MLAQPVARQPVGHLHGPKHRPVAAPGPIGSIIDHFRSHRIQRHIAGQFEQIIPFFNQDGLVAALKDRPDTPVRPAHELSVNPVEVAHTLGVHTRLAQAARPAQHNGMELPTHDPHGLANQLTPLLTDEPAVIYAYLFGSVARGDAGPRSDVDIAVLTPDEIEPGLLKPLTRLKLNLEDALGRRVDLVHLNQVPPDLVHRVLRDGLLLIDKAPNRRVAFEVQSRNEYWDLLPILNEYRGARGNS